MQISAKEINQLLYDHMIYTKKLTVPRAITILYGMIPALLVMGTMQLTISDY